MRRGIRGNSAERVGACFAWVKHESPGMKFRHVDRLTARQRGIVSDRGELATNEESVSNIHGHADDHYERDGEEKARN